MYTVLARTERCKDRETQRYKKAMAGVHEIELTAGGCTLMMHRSYLSKEGCEASLEGC